MKLQATVSIIIPVYNTEKYLRECLDSVLNQTFKDFECICINDCSTDNSRSILEEYAKKDDRFIVINLSENKGQGEARNYGLNIAKGKYITFVDSDYWVTSDCLEVLYKAIENYDTDFVSAKFFLFDNLTHTTETNYREPKISFSVPLYAKEDKKNVLKNITFMQTSTVCGNIFKKVFLSTNNIYFQSIKFEDTLFMWEAIIRADKFIFIKDTIYFYRINRQNSTMSLFTIEDKINYYLKLKELSQQKFKDYFLFCYAYILLRILFAIERLPLEQSELIFVKTKELFFDNSYNLVDYDYTSNINRIRLVLFSFCLKYDLKKSLMYLAKIFYILKTLIRYPLKYIK